MDTRIFILSDNRTDNPLLQTEHGLSVYMECGVGKLLLDTGASDLFIHNAEALGIDLREVDYCLISHGHNDHIGGLPFSCNRIRRRRSFFLQRFLEPNMLPCAVINIPLRVMSISHSIVTVLSS